MWIIKIRHEDWWSYLWGGPKVTWRPFGHRYPDKQAAIEGAIEASYIFKEQFIIAEERGK